MQRVYEGLTTAVKGSGQKQDLAKEVQLYCKIDKALPKPTRSSATYKYIVYQNCPIVDDMARPLCLMALRSHQIYSWD